MKVFLDDIELEKLPLGLDTINEVIELDLSIHGYIRYFELPLTFIGDGYKYLYDAKSLYGFCRKIEVRIEVPTNQGTNIARGFLFLTDCSFDHTKKTAEVDITDNTYGVFITEAKELKVSPAATVTRGFETLTPVTATDITLFTPSTGSDLGTDAKMYELAATVEHVIKYLSDNGLQFSQSYFTGDFKFYLSNHYYIKNRGTAPDIQFSFIELMEQGFKLFSMWFKVDNSTAPPTFNWVQGESNFFEDHGGITWSNIRNLIEEFYPERFFSTVNVGDPNAIIERGSTYQLPTVTLVGFKEETFNAGNDCALENKLELISSWFIDHNKLEFFVASTDYEEGALLIYVDSSNNAHKGTYAKDGNMRYYNEELLNYKVLNRHDIGTILTQALGADTSSFRAYKTGNTTLTADNTTTPYPFPEETGQGFDTGGNYNNATYRYVAPSTGSYKFLVNLEYIVAGIQDDLNFGLDGNVTINILFNKRKSTGTLLQFNQASIVHLTPSSDTYIKQRTAEFFMEATDYVDISIEVDFFYAGANNSLTINGGAFNASGDYTGTYFATSYVFNNGGTAELADLMDYKASALKFNDFTINANDWNSLKQNPSQGVHVNNGGANSLCWIKSIRRNLKTGRSQVEMLTSPILTQL